MNWIFVQLRKHKYFWQRLCKAEHHWFIEFILCFYLFTEDIESASLMWGEKGSFGGLKWLARPRW